MPVRVAWGVIVLSIALRHPSIEHCLGELRRNESLRRLIGIRSEEAVPKKWNLSRFLDTLGREPHLSLLHEVFNQIVRKLGAAVPNLGENTAGDATGLNARRKKSPRAETEITEGLPQASGGRKEYLDDDGNVVKVVEWFGFKLHLLADVKNEVALAYRITDTKTGDGETLPLLLSDAQENLPEGPYPNPGLRQGGRYQRRASPSFRSADQAGHSEPFSLEEGGIGTDAARPRRELERRLRRVGNRLLLRPDQRTDGPASDVVYRL